MLEGIHQLLSLMMFKSEAIFLSLHRQEMSKQNLEIQFTS